MTFFDSIKTVFRKYAEFEGRASRPEFWWFTLFSALVSGALGSLNIYTTTGAVGGQGMYDLAGTTSTIYLGAALASLWGFVVLLPSLAVTVRRLRDAGHRWVEIFWILLPIAGLVILIIRLTDAPGTGTRGAPAPTAPAAAPAAPAAPPAPAAPSAPAAPPAATAPAPAAPVTKPATTRKPATTKPASTKPATTKPTPKP